MDRLRLVLGTSMGGSLVWLWGQTYPDFMDALMPVASLPARHTGRNRMWRRMIMDLIRTDPEWEGGEYAAQPQSLRHVGRLGMYMIVSGFTVYKEAPDPASADRLLEAAGEEFMKATDANDVLYAFDAGWDYDPGPGLGRIASPLIAVNFADDLLIPAELGTLEREIRKVKKGRAVLIPRSERTRGHQTILLAGVWKNYLAVLFSEK